MVEYIRTMVEADHDANDRVEEKLDREGWGDFAKFLGALFFLTIDRRLGESATQEEVIRFVAEIRAGSPVDPEFIDANAAERLIRSAIDPAVGHDVEPEMVGRIQALVIVHVLSNEGVSVRDREALFNEAIGIVENL